MIKLAVIIPYFQREPGILRRALVSILGQELPADTVVDVVVVDDASPIPASGETAGLDFSGPLSLTVIKQANGGVAAARNTGLHQVTDDTTYIAFLDSDDIWHPTHLRAGLQALENGRDLYFCDNRRDGHFASSFQSRRCPDRHLHGYASNSWGWRL